MVRHTCPEDKSVELKSLCTPPAQPS